jgi:hypothetical protein
MERSKISKLLRGIATLILFILIGSFFLLKNFNKDTPWIDLFYSLFPEITGTIIIFIIIDYFYIKDFINTRENTANLEVPHFQNIHNGFNGIEKKINEIENRLDNIGHSIFTNKFEKFLISGAENGKNIKWESIIRNTNFSLEIVVNYFDTWITKNRDILVEFLNKENSTLTVIIPNTENPEVIKNLTALMPKHNQSQIIKKINETEHRLQELMKKENIAQDKLKIYKCNINFNFTMQIFDNKYLYFSIVEMNRDVKFKSPFFVINLSENITIKDFFEKEITGLKDKSICTS